MPCPFLKETQVRYCETSAVRKMIPLPEAGGAEEKCSGPEHVSCPVFHAQPERPSELGLCPYLRESLMQYCGAASVAKFVPYSESLLSRCGNDSYRYCELYLDMANPAVPSHDVDGIAMPERLSYSANHMWLDLTDDGICHVGVDAFLARVLGDVDQISFPSQKGRQHPTVALSVAGIDLQLVFPNVLQLTNCNLYLRANPARLTSEPYTGGWLFEGVSEPATGDRQLNGAAGRAWMAEEHRRINEYLQQQFSPGLLAADGGLFSAGLARHLEREQTLALFNEFFSPYASDKRDL